MRRRPRWERWISLGVATLAVGVWPVAARTEKPKASPPLRVQVQYGDSVWTIAKRHGDRGRDVRAIVAEMIRVNDVSPAALQPGQCVLIPADCLDRANQ